MKTLALAAALLGLLAGSVAAVIFLWRDLASEVSLLGWIMIAMGAVLSVGLGVGLMALSFFSARNGYDERAHEEGERLNRDQ